MTYTAIVPARSGSKRLPNKNIKMLGGKPLVVWTLEACINSKHISKVIFSTDSQEYWQTAKSYIASEKLVLSLRTSDEAGDKVKIFDYIKEKANDLFGKEEKIVLTLPTMPFRTAKDIDNAIDVFERTGKPVFSAVEYDFHVSFAFSMDGDDWIPLSLESPMLTGNTRSQDQLAMYHPNGAIYVRNMEDMQSDGLKTFYQGAVPYIMDRKKTVDIDTEDDFLVAEALSNIL